MPSTGVDIPAGVLEAHYASLLGDAERRNKHADGAIARQTDTAQHGLKVIEAVAAYELLVSNDANERARMNAAMWTPRQLPLRESAGGGP